MFERAARDVRGVLGDGVGQDQPDQGALMGIETAEPHEKFAH